MNEDCIRALNALLIIAPLPAKARCVPRNWAALRAAIAHVCTCTCCERMLRSAAIAAKSDADWNAYLETATRVGMKFFIDMPRDAARVRLASIALSFCGGCEVSLQNLIAYDSAYVRVEDMPTLYEAWMHTQLCSECYNDFHRFIMMAAASSDAALSFLAVRLPNRHMRTREDVQSHARWLMQMLSPIHRTDTERPTDTHRPSRSFTTVPALRTSAYRRR